MGKSVKSQKRYGVSDDSPLFWVRRDLSGGSNTRQNPNILQDNEVQTLQNCNIEVQGQTSRRPGLTLVEDVGANKITGMFGYDPQQQTANLLITEGVNLKRWTGSGTFASVSTAFTTGLNTTMIKAYKTAVGDVTLIGNGTDNWKEMTPAYAINDLGSTSGTGNDSPPKSTVATFYRNRVWILKGDLLYYSDASPADYSVAFDTGSQAFRIPVGEERAVYGTRDLGLIVAGKEQIWSLNPSTVPAATDKPEKLLDIGVVTGKTFCQVGDDYLFLATDGVRALKRTIQDKIQLGNSQPLSYRLKDEFDQINWNYISGACAVYWQNKYFISLPKVGSTVNNMVWVYFPGSNGWAVINGWSVSSWATFKVGGEERLYAGDSTDGKIYRAWYGASDNGSAISFILEGKQEDFAKPLTRKVGAEIKVVAEPTGDYDLNVLVSLDGGGFNTVGTMNLSGNLITFSTGFPVNFYPDALVYKKFHLDSYGPFYHLTYKITHNAVTANAEDIIIYEVSATALQDEYISEETV
jgi:hypothetical protein